MSDSPSVPTASRAKPAAAKWTTLNALGWANVLGAAAAVVGLALFLAPQWRHNVELTHGWFTPIVFFVLIQEARAAGPWRYLTRSSIFLVTLMFLVVAGLILLTAAGLYAAALDWTHSLVAATATAAVCAFLSATWLSLADENVKVVPFNWTTGVAIILWLMSAPIPPGTYANITQALQSAVTTTVVKALHLLGIAAVQHGNIIETTRVNVGVEEACSGIRSLISCIYTGLFFAAVLVRQPWARFVIIAVAGPLALVMNFIRSLTLTLMAHNGVEIRGGWHDVTGYSILAIAGGMLAAFAFFLGRFSPKSVQQPPDVDSVGAVPVAQSPTTWPRAVVVSGFVAATLIVGFFISQSRPATTTNRPTPNLATLLPSEFPGWTTLVNKDLYRFSAELQTPHLTQTTFERSDAHSYTEITVYLAYWPSGRAPVSLVASHTPDACWPGNGWTALHVENPRSTLALAGRQVEEAEQRIFEQQGQTEHVWYWHLYDGHVIHPDNVRSPKRLLFLAWKYGFKREGEQLFVRISSNKPWDQISTEPLLQEIFARLVPFGL
ncbi:MAG: exosortase/archaeosortase family protein [Nibricoccus sp.]